MSGYPTNRYSRFLRARRWAIDGAYKQFKDTEDWRSANQVDTLYGTIDSEAYQKLRGLVRGLSITLSAVIAH